MNNSLTSKVSALALITALSATTPELLTAQVSEECVSRPDGVIPEDCAHRNFGDAVAMPIEPNTEPAFRRVDNSDGFVLAVDGVPINADRSVSDRIRRTDIALERADIQVTVDSHVLTPRLDVETAGADRAYRSGDSITLVSETNYPAFINRAEMRIIDRDAVGGPKLVAIVPVDANGRVTVQLPEGKDLVVVHRVYGARGRYDETLPLPLMQPDDRGQVDGVEEGTQFTARRSIRVNGGSITVSARNVPQGATMQTMGEAVQPDPNGRVVLQRIVPPGEIDVRVDIVGNGRNIGLTRPANVPGAEWFYVVVGDVTVGRYSDGQSGRTATRTDGSLQFYIDGETEDGYQVTASVDTDLDSFDDILRRDDDGSPRGILRRIDPSDGYPTYGDDSTSFDNTPTSGQLYLRVERDNSFVLWGDMNAQLDGNSFVRNERTLYGLQGHYETVETTSRGEPRTEIDVYAAQPDQAVGRDVFRGTGGSVYFLSKQDLAVGTETVSIEVRDAATGRVTDRIFLTEGTDYQVNHLQGLIALNAPLTGSASSNLIQTNPGGDEIIALVVQYEYTPTGSDLDGYVFGGRFERWATENLRFGVTGMSDDTGIADQTTVGADIRYQVSERSFAQLDFARSSGPGFDTSLSDDGGLVFDTNSGATGTGEAFRLEGQADLNDLGYERDGLIGAYAERRTEGFSSLDYNVGAETGDETLYGVFAKFEPVDGGLGFGLYADRYENKAGTRRTELGVEMKGSLQENLSFETALENLDETTSTSSGSRTDAGFRVTYTPSDVRSYYVFGQATLSRSNLESNERLGFGSVVRYENGWTVEGELSTGRGGLGGRIFANHSGDQNASSYFGYELDPGRAIASGISSTDNGGRFVAGGRRALSDNATMVAENTYDIFGDSRELISMYGVEYRANEFTTYSLTLDFGELTDDVNGDIARHAVTLGVRRDTEDFRGRARLEFRQDDYENVAEPDTNAVFLVADAEWKLSEQARLVFNFDGGDTEANGTSFEDGRFVDASIGYAFRPVNNERLNVLARYRYFYDTLGQEVDGIVANGPVQESHVVSLEANYDLDEYWTIGGKLGARLTDSAPTAGDPYASNDAWIAVANARYHLVHNWDILIEGRHLELVDAQSSETGVLGAVYRHFGNNVQVGVGYNFGVISDDLTDLTFDDKGVFLNLVASF